MGIQQGNLAKEERRQGWSLQENISSLKVLKCSSAVEE